MRRKGLSSLNPGKNRLIPIGTETDSKGRVTKNGYGVFNLSWQAEQHPEWPDMVMAEVDEIRRQSILTANGTATLPGLPARRRMRAETGRTSALP